MAFYEHVFITRPDLSVTQAEGLISHFSQILKDNGGKVVDDEYWGLKSLAFKALILFSYLSSIFDLLNDSNNSSGVII